MSEHQHTDMLEAMQCDECHSFVPISSGTELAAKFIALAERFALEAHNAKTDYWRGQKDGQSIAYRMVADELKKFKIVRSQ